MPSDHVRTQIRALAKQHVLALQMGDDEDVLDSETWRLRISAEGVATVWSKVTKELRPADQSSFTGYEDRRVTETLCLLRLGRNPGVHPYFRGLAALLRANRRSGVETGNIYSYSSPSGDLRLGYLLPVSIYVDEGALEDAAKQLGVPVEHWALDPDNDWCLQEVPAEPLEVTFPEPKQQPPQEEKKNMSNTTTPDQKSIFERAKAAAMEELPEAAVRVAARQLTKLMCDPLAALIAGPDSSALMRQTVAGFLRGDMGRALVGAASSLALQQFLQTSATTPTDRTFWEKVLRELRIEAMATGGDHLVEMVTSPMRQVLTTALSGLQLPATPPELSEGGGRQVVDGHVEEPARN